MAVPLVALEGVHRQGRGRKNVVLGSVALRRKTEKSAQHQKNKRKKESDGIWSIKYRHTARYTAKKDGMSIDNTGQC